MNFSTIYSVNINKVIFYDISPVHATIKYILYLF